MALNYSFTCIVVVFAVYQNDRKIEAFGFEYFFSAVLKRALCIGIEAAWTMSIKSKCARIALL